MRPSTYHRPKTVEEALKLLAQPATTALAGGTKLLAGDLSAQAVVDLQALGLDQIHLDQNKLHIGAMVRLADWAAYLAAHAGPDSPGNLLREAIRRAGPNTYRNAATAGGTVAARLPDSELLAAMLLLNGELLLQRPEPEMISIADYLAAEERPGGLITEIRLAWERGQGRSERVARTPADYPIVSVAMWQPEGQPPRLAATGIDLRPVRLTPAEALLAAAQSEEVVAAAAAAAAGQCRNPGDFRGDTRYRAAMAAVLTRRLFSLS